MIGVVCSALAALTASLVAGRQHRHRPIAAALWVAQAYAVSVEAGSSAYAPRLTLVVWALAAVTASWAYLDAWGQRGAWWPALAIAVTLAGALLFGGRERWLLATWGPLAVSAACGIVGAVHRCFAERRAEEVAVALYRTNFGRLNGEIKVRNHRPIGPATITQRVALVLTASDVACLLFIPWPHAQEWQGRVSAIVVAGMQLYWYWKNRRTS